MWSGCIHIAHEDLRLGRHPKYDGGTAQGNEKTLVWLYRMVIEEGSHCGWVNVTLNPTGGYKALVSYATLMGIKKAKTKEIKVVSAGEASPASAVIEKLYAPEKNKQGQIFDGDPKAAAAKLVEKLRFEARVI